MPESPEVDELASILSERVVGRTIERIDIVLGKALKTPHPSPSPLLGNRVTGVVRYGKMIDLVTESTDGDALHLVVHFGHDGWVLWHDVVPDTLVRAGDATLIARVRLDDGSGFDLTDAGQYKLATVHIVAQPEDVPAVAKLGPDPLSTDFDPEAFVRTLAGRRKQIKALLQDQTAFAGIGNAYSDEILHAAKISPLTHAASLSDEQVARLVEQTPGVLHSARDARRGIAPSELRAAKHAALRVHRKAGTACPVCGDTIREFTSSGAAAQYCPTCQGALA